MNPRSYSAVAVFVVALAPIFAPRPAFAQANPTPPPAGKTATQAKPAPAAKPPLSSALRDQWKFISEEFISAADAMPEEKYGFAPTNGEFQGVRTFAEQVKHVACANFAFFSEMEKKTPPPDCEKGGPSPAKTKAELMQYVGASFAYGDTVIAKVTTLNMLDKIEGHYAGPNTRVGMVITAVWHATDHYGQMVEYLRMNGIIPPASR
jgi:hypothetical protein